MKKYVTVIVICLLLVGNSLILPIDAREYYYKTIRITPNLDLVVSVLASYEDGVYSNVSDAALFLDGITDMSFEDKKTTLKNIGGNNYEVVYSIVASSPNRQDTYTRKTITGSVFFRSFMHQICLKTICNY